MTSKEALGNLKEDFYERFPDDWGQELWVKIEHDLEILNILKHCITFTDNTITFNATITDEHEIKLLKEWISRE